MNYSKMFGALFFIFSVTYVGWNGYHYFFDKYNPTVQLIGLQKDGYYAGEIACIVNGHHPYKVKYISLFLDGAPLIHNFSIGKKEFEHPFSLNTQTLKNGPHTLDIKATDGTYYKNTATQSLSFNVDNTPLQAAFVQQNNDKKIFQGKTLHVQFQVNKPLKNAKFSIFSKNFNCYPEKKNTLIYEAFIPIDCEETPTEYPFAIHCMDAVENNVVLEGKVHIIEYPFKKNTLAVNQEKMKQEREASSEEGIYEHLAQLSEQSPQEKLWNGNFLIPTEMGRITTEFGTVRTTQDRGLYRHKGIDIANAPRNVVWAPQSGKIIVKDRFTITGNTVVIDHGCGILSLFGHLDSIPETLQVGDIVTKGNKIGTVGKTGYATGYHLHWEMRINNIPIDPMQWTKPTLS